MPRFLGLRNVYCTMVSIMTYPDTCKGDTAHFEPPNVMELEQLSKQIAQQPDYLERGGPERGGTRGVDSTHIEWTLAAEEWNEYTLGVAFCALSG